MPKWISCGPDFITGDTIRWTEPAWKEKTRKSSRSQVVGEHFMVAEVLAVDGEWARVLVKSCETTKAEDWHKPIKSFKPGEVLNRRRGPIGKGGAERLTWSDESVRDLVASKFMGPEAAQGPSAPQAPAREGPARRIRAQGPRRSPRASGRRGPKLTP